MKYEYQPPAQAVNMHGSTSVSPVFGKKEKGKSHRTGRQEGNTVFSKNKSSYLQASSCQLQLFVMQGSEAIPNVKILSDNLNTCASTTRAQKLFHKLSSRSILDGENLSPFWNELSSRISSGLSLPTATDSVDWNGDWLSGIADTMQSNSWFSISRISVQNKSLFRICCPSDVASVGGCAASERISQKKARSYGKNPLRQSNKPKPNSVLKIPLFPDLQQHLIWKKWLAAYRWVYNQCVEFYNQGRALAPKQSLDQYIQQLQSLPLNEWTKCLGNTRQEAVCEALCASRQSRKANGGKCYMRFRSCQNKSQAIQFNPGAYRNGKWFQTKVEGTTFAVAKGHELPRNCEYGTKLVYQRGQWFGCFPQHVPVRSTSSDKVIALDPGNRTFLTGYDAENVLEIGKGDIGRLTRLCLHLDKLIGRKIKASRKINKRLRYKLNKAIARGRFKIRSLVDDLHRKAASLLVNNYKLIFLPAYQTSQMVVKANRKINRKSVRNMLTWAMGRFAFHLEQAAKRKGVLVVRCNEAYTSKTCPQCGHVHKKLGGSKVHFCPACGNIAPRDWVGALNILLRALQAVAFDVRDGVITIYDADVILAQSQYELCEG